MYFERALMIYEGALSFKLASSQLEAFDMESFQQTITHMMADQELMQCLLRVTMALTFGQQDTC